MSVGTQRPLTPQSFLGQGLLTPLLPLQSSRYLPLFGPPASPCWPCRLFSLAPAFAPCPWQRTACLTGSISWLHSGSQHPGKLMSLILASDLDPRQISLFEPQYPSISIRTVMRLTLWNHEELSKTAGASRQLFPAFRESPGLCQALDTAR